MSLKALETLIHAMILVQLLVNVLKEKRLPRYASFIIVVEVDRRSITDLIEHDMS